MGESKSPVRDRWRDAVWESDLPAHARLVALAYADHVRLVADKWGPADPNARAVWVVHARLVVRTGMATNSATKARTILIDRGWLTETEPPIGRRAGRYALTIPASSSVATSATQPEVVESQRVRLNSQALSRNPKAVESQSEALSVAHVATELQELHELHADQTLGFRGNSPRARPEPETHDPFAADDPWERLQEVDEPPAHAAAVFADLAAQAIGAEADRADLKTCDHGIVRGLMLGSGELACDDCRPHRQATA
jgi:hypothetical protein